MLVFIDESGHPRPNDSTKNPVLVGVCIHENDIKPITNQIYKLKDSIYGKQDEVKSTNLIRESNFKKNRTRNISYATGMVDILSSFKTAVFAIVMERPDSPIVIPESHLPKQYYLLLKKIEYYCLHQHREKALIIYDGIDGKNDKRIADSFTGFLFRTSRGRSFRHILEMPLFVNSAVTPTIQIADILAGIIRHYYEAELDKRPPENEYETWLSELFSKVYKLTENNRVPRSKFIEYGFQKIHKNYSYLVSKKSQTTDDME
ncbi:MAG: DUF3800 domain-containing protein [Lachnospiraceae bacterium]|nr:DUF3800 domain-containing protein [Lachnospiraceae bacterium]